MNTFHNPNRPDSNQSISDVADRDLLAFRYLAAELTTAEADSFESLMLEDQAARESLARVVETVSALQTISLRKLPTTTADSPTIANLQHRRWIAPTITLAAAICLTLMFVFGLFDGSPSEDGKDHVIAKSDAKNVPPASDSESDDLQSQLASLWLDQLMPEEESLSIDSERAQFDAADVDDKTGNDDMNSNQPTDFSVSDWYLDFAEVLEEDAQMLPEDSTSDDHSKDS